MPPSPRGGAHGKPPLSPASRGVPPGARGRAFFPKNDAPVEVECDVADDPPPGDGGDVDNDNGGGHWNWTREELETWPGREPAPATPVVAVLNNKGGHERRDDDDEGEQGEGGGDEGGEQTAFWRSRARVSSSGGLEPPVLTRVLPYGLEVKLSFLAGVGGGGKGGA